jgi:hypothetical protein
MRSQEEIEEKLESFLKEKSHCEEWVSTARKKFGKEKEFWGKDADDGELRYATDCLSDVQTSINALLWVLNRDKKQSSE